MDISWKIGWRYLVGKKSTNAIHIITGISVFGLAFGTAAIVLILSVFNGFESLLLDMYNAFNPDIKITVKEGKSFEQDSSRIFQIQQLPAVDSLSLSLEELALFDYNKRQEVGTLKGVDPSFDYVTELSKAVSRGEYLIQDDRIKYGIFGLGMAYKLGINLHDRLSPVTIFLPNTKKTSPLDKQFSSALIYPGGTFTIQQEVDYQYAIVPLEVVRGLTKKPTQLSAIEIRLEEDADAEEAVKAIQAIVGPDFDVKDRMQQEASTIKVMRIEKWLAFMILILALVLVALNLIGAIWMIVLEKQHDLAVLTAMGATQQMIKQIFLRLGFIICGLGLFGGIILAFIFYKLHKTFGLISLGEHAVVDDYPMEMYWSDIPIVALAVIVIGLISVSLPAIKAGKFGISGLRR
jgi:lipoprotein-releasing system permease protein